MGSLFALFFCLGYFPHSLESTGTSSFAALYKNYFFSLHKTEHSAIEKTDFTWSQIVILHIHIKLQKIKWLVSSTATHKVSLTLFSTFLTMNIRRFLVQGKSKKKITNWTTSPSGNIKKKTKKNPIESLTSIFFSSLC